jgi:glucosamine-6-phosphate deaminase
MDLWNLMTIPREALGKGTSVHVRIGGTSDDLAEMMAAETADLIRTGRPVTAIVPVGPVGQYARLARMIAEEGLNCSRVTFINMDEFLSDDGRWIDPAHPLSFRGFMDRAFYDLLPSGTSFLPENRIFPDPNNLAALAKQIDERGGVDVCFGGIGLNGHLAFNEPEWVADAEFAARPARVLAVAPESRAHTAVNLACALDLIPRRAVTVGMREILAARRLSIYANRQWQCGVVRQAVHGPVTPLCPASYLQCHPDAWLTVADYVAESREVRLQ